MRWRGWESNPRHHDFQSCALPTELPRLGTRRVAAQRKASDRGASGLIALAHGWGRAAIGLAVAVLTAGLAFSGGTVVDRLGAGSAACPRAMVADRRRSRGRAGSSVRSLGRRSGRWPGSAVAGAGAAARAGRAGGGRGGCTGARCWCCGRWPTAAAGPSPRAPATAGHTSGRATPARSRSPSPRPATGRGAARSLASCSASTSTPRPGSTATASRSTGARRRATRPAGPRRPRGPPASTAPHADRPPWRDRADYQEGDAGDYLGNAIASRAPSRRPRTVRRRRAVRERRRGAGARGRRPGLRPRLGRRLGGAAVPAAGALPARAARCCGSPPTRPLRHRPLRETGTAARSLDGADGLDAPGASPRSASGAPPCA